MKKKKNKSRVLSKITHDFDDQTASIIKKKLWCDFDWYTGCSEKYVLYSYKNWNYIRIVS